MDIGSVLNAISQSHVGYIHVAAATAVSVGFNSHVRLNQPRGNLAFCSNYSGRNSGDVPSVFPALPPLDEITMERVMEEFEHRCHENMTHAMETEEGLGIEYDEDVVCDVCQSPDGEDNNEMVFCDKCNICVHQVRDSLLVEE